MMKNFLIVAILVGILFILACTNNNGGEVRKTNKRELMTYLPDNAVILDNIGNGWHTVRIGNTIYLAIVQATYGFNYNVHLVPYKNI